MRYTNDGRHLVILDTMKTSFAIFFGRLPVLSLFLLLSILLWGCKDASPVSGIIASVNGQGISYREVEARRINQFSGRGLEGKVWSEAEMQAQYRYIVNQIIEELVICQYMESKKIALDPTQLDAEEKLIRDDYPAEAFDRMLMEEGIGLEEWREALRRRLTINQFLTQVLRPEITITSDEVQQYFTEHSADFLIPEQWHFMQITGLDKKAVENARNSLIMNKNPAAAQKEFLVSIRDIRIGKDRLPEDLSKELTPLGRWKGSAVKAVDGEFRTLVLIEKTPATMLEAAEMAKRVEQALAEEKMRVLYTAWVKKRVFSARIRLAPALLAENLPTEEPVTEPFSAPVPVQGHNATEKLPGHQGRELTSASPQSHNATVIDNRPVRGPSPTPAEAPSRKGLPPGFFVKPTEK